MLCIFTKENKTSCSTNIQCFLDGFEVVVTGQNSIRYVTMFPGVSDLWLVVGKYWTLVEEVLRPIT